MVGGHEIFVATSGVLNLTCVISFTNNPPSVIHWYHDNLQLSIGSGLSLVVDKSDITTASLLLQGLTLAHSGIYKCDPDNAPSASTLVHVLDGEMTAQLSSGNHCVHFNGFFGVILRYLFSRRV